MTGVLQSVLAQLPDAFGWDSEPSIWGALRDARIRVARMGLLAQMPHAEQLLLPLPPESQVRILAAPELWYRTQRGRDLGKPLGPFLEAAVEAEWAVADVPTSEGRWTALGDWWFPAGTYHRDYRGGTDLREDAVYRAPSARGIPVDNRSPWTRGPLEEVSGGDRTIGFGPLSSTVGHLEAAFDVIGATAPSADLAIRSLVEVIALRADVEPEARFTSASTRLALGRLILRNPHNAAVLDLVDGIVHETVHFALDTFETQARLIIDRDQAGAMLPSPWTGRRLNLDTYIQACFVWYALFNFWFARIASLSADGPDALRLMGRSAKGFRDRAMTEVLGPRSSSLAEGLLDSLNEMQTRVNTKIAAVETALAQSR